MIYTLQIIYNHKYDLRFANSYALVEKCYIVYPPVVYRAKRPSQTRPNRNSRETNVDEILAYSDKKTEHRKSRETCIDDIIAEHDLSGDTNIDDIVPDRRFSRVSNVDSLDDRQSNVSTGL